jgi:hypothetical protein
MANIRVIQSPYIGPFSNIENVIESSTGSGVGIHVGELGGRVELTQTGVGTKEYQKVQLDSGAVAAAASGAPTLGEMVYWKDKSKYLVTNDSRFAVGGQTTNGWRNEVAGIIVTPTASLATFAGLAPYIWVQQKGNNTAVKITSSSPNPGDKLISDTSTTAAQGLIVTAGAAAPVVMELGRFSLAQTTVTSAAVDLDIPGIP